MEMSYRKKNPIFFIYWQSLVAREKERRREREVLIRVLGTALAVCVCVHPTAWWYVETWENKKI